MDYKALKSGSDVRGTAIETSDSPITLTDDAVFDITNAFVVMLKDKTKKDKLKIALGHDSRLSAQRIADAATKALLMSGVEIYFSALSSTPAMFMMTQYPFVDCDGSIMITASHHPYHKNGLKFFTKDGGLDGQDISNILQLAQEKAACQRPGGTIIRKDFMQYYCDMLVQKVRTQTGEDLPLKGFKIAVDAGNGAGGFYADRVLAVLGADVSSAQFLQPDGRFPNHIPNPEDKDAMQSISARVTQTNSDLGIIFDTDVDRAAIVGDDGSEMNRNKLIALIADILLSENKGATIVTDSVTSDGLAQFIAARGGKHHRYKRGYKNVINEAVRLCGEGENALLAIETSGHAALKENYFLDDGAYLVTRLIIKAAELKKLGKKLTDLIADLPSAADEFEARLTFKTDNWKDYGQIVIQALAEFCGKNDDFVVAPTNYEGIRANVKSQKGWFLVRMSVHDPIMPINIESDTVGGAKTIAQVLHSYLKQFDKLTIDALNQ